MKTIWAENPEIINEEINLLINNRYALTLYQKDAQAQTVKAFAIDDSNSETLLVFIADSQLNAKHDECLIFYQVHGQAIRCFKGQAKKTSMKAVAITFPQEIYTIQRRNHPRVETPDNSLGTFNLKGRKQLNPCQVIDVSTEGAKLSGDFNPGLKKGDIILHLSLNLRLSYSDMEEKINISEATIKWVKNGDKGLKEIGVYFKTSDINSKSLEHYIDMCLIEEEVRS